MSCASQNAVLPSGDLDYSSIQGTEVYAAVNCSSFDVTASLNASKASLFYITHNDYDDPTPLRITGTKRRGEDHDDPRSLGGSR